MTHLASGTRTPVRHWIELLDDADDAETREVAETAASTAPPRSRAAYRHFIAIPTRWMDNDAYGHVNNVTYYSYFDTAVNEHLIRAGGLDIVNGAAIGLVVETELHISKAAVVSGSGRRRAVASRGSARRRSSTRSDCFAPATTSRRHSAASSTSGSIASRSGRSRTAGHPRRARAVARRRSATMSARASRSPISCDARA